MPDTNQYLTDEATVETLCAFLERGKTDDAVAYLKSLGDPKTVAGKWIGAQCDLNNIKGSPTLSEQIAWPGVYFMLENNFKKGAAMMLHNLTAFYMPNWDQEIDPTIAHRLVKAAKQAVELRRELDDPAGFGWSIWDLGMSHLVGGEIREATAILEEAARSFDEKNDANGAAWARLFIGKAYFKHYPAQKEEGKRIMEDSRRVILDIGEDWEKEEVVKILATVGLA